MSCEELSKRVCQMEEQLSVLWAERTAKEKKKEYNRVAWEKQVAAKVAANEKYLLNLDTCCLAPKGKGTFRGRDRRLDAMIPKWAEKAMHFGKMNKPCLFLQWLAWSWNNNTYRAKPITSGRGYYWKFYGWASTDGKKPMRSKYTEMQLFGKTLSTKFNPIQADNFAEAPWWGWGWGVLKQVVSHLEDDLEVWNDLPSNFRRTVGVMCGGYGMVELKKGLIFDQNAGAQELNKTYRIVKPALDLGWKSVLKGIKASREPTLPATTKVV